MADEKQEKHNFHAVIPWHKLKKYLDGLQQKVSGRLRRAKGSDDILRLQGESLLLEQLMDLPEALTLADGDDEEKGS